jgi:hypothetical protein
MATETSKLIVALATYHEFQHIGHKLNGRFQGAIELIQSEHDPQVILEEWRPRPDEASFASTLQTPTLKWENVGTPDEPQFKTSVECLNYYPPTYDPTRPSLREYGPLQTQELRENYMVERIRRAMEPHKVGLFIVGLAHLHSILVKIEAAGFEVRGYSWTGE